MSSHCQTTEILVHIDHYYNISCHYKKARMVKWYNLRLPREGPGFDSRLTNTTVYVDEGFRNILDTEQERSKMDYIIYIAPMVYLYYTSPLLTTYTDSSLKPPIINSKKTRL
ncbi:hypothetical protein PHYBLDRAFT_150169 [Phycomyces blakesleeanus NRRL 1555(-)]|uniref:Uncharacterized protein n=1 Tax=Phycomyces blakesleeanus (strain ATCC 8743b / DSM 1359 / FGSC 10004 / NBRC 33097 / NRRL 1555) TaxID=763407 RepID=A0A162WKB6_PHYB8|nr:hypothetical protein PHYBLDRAFT_150169 [Phycomyces blakesleeanus NRRL 1555(-)]OAD68575.1 hypothetical protein PHYBLDRAFT_150169 [Phycomyces blakesleeanus NRRL 1555(-)]|eukprot:XP_018286615.1 hypothetical protein PHYBLDRAFT_150169 [Phycomyces blakesleeanus NRRL 1555(-)]